LQNRLPKLGRGYLSRDPGNVIALRSKMARF